jgi:hypothetical protein
MTDLMLETGFFELFPVLKKAETRFQKKPKKFHDTLRRRGIPMTGGVDGTRTRDPRRDRPVF